jgi:hypothetical protein
MKTSDVYLAAALLALGYSLEKVDRTDPRHMVFEFLRATPQGNIGGTVERYTIQTVETRWANRSLIVNAFDFAEAIKRMKSLIHSS